MRQYGPQQGARDEITLIVEIGSLTRPDGQQLACVIPFVGGGCDIQPVIALQADELGAECARQYPRQLGLAGPGLALDEQRTPEAQRQKDTGGELGARDIVLREQQRAGRLDGGRPAQPSACCTATRARRGMSCAR